MQTRPVSNPSTTSVIHEYPLGWFYYSSVARSSVVRSSRWLRVQLYQEAPWSDAVARLREIRTLPA